MSHRDPTDDVIRPTTIPYRADAPPEPEPPEAPAHLRTVSEFIEHDLGPLVLWAVIALASLGAIGGIIMVITCIIP